MKILFAFSLLWVYVFAAEQPFAATSLEFLMSRAYNGRVADGTWFQIFGDFPDLFPQSFCTGATENWPLPFDVEGDLLRLIRSQVFNCGYVQNTTYYTGSNSPNNSILIQTDAGSTVTGPIADFWSTLISYAAEAVNVSLTLNWKLFLTSDATFEALLNGEVDGVCGYSAPDGHFLYPGTNESVSRSIVFSSQTCPTFFEQRYIYVNKTDNITTFPEFVDNLLNYSQICVTGTPRGGFVTSCDNSFLPFNEPVTCTGYGLGAFDAFFGGNCQAVWGGYPTAAQAGQLTAIAMPDLYSPVSYFRQRDLPPQQPFISTKTSLEIVMTRAFEEMAFNGVWFNTFASLPGIKPTGFCNGDVDQWPIPIDVVPGSDLDTVLRNNTFRWYVRMIRFQCDTTS